MSLGRMSVRDYEDKDVKVGGRRQHVPKFSVFEEKCSCCNCHVSYFPEIDRYFFNQWECNWKFPSIIIILATVSAAITIWSAINILKSIEQYIIIGLVGFCYLMWAISYFLAMCKSPGYLPFYWSIEGGTEYTYEEQMLGVITNQEQYEFASGNSRPDRATLSKQAHRLVLRADHICPWISNWVGLKNYRYFFNNLLWTLLLFLVWFAHLAQLIYYLITQGWHTTPPTIIMFILSIPIILFFIFFAVVFTRHIRYLMTNMTTILELKNERDKVKDNPYDLGCWNNCSETMGPKECCLCWFFPIPLPRLNAGIFWRRNDETNNEVLDTASEFPRHRADIYQSRPQTDAADLEYSPDSAVEMESEQIKNAGRFGFDTLSNLSKQPALAEHMFDEDIEKHHRRRMRAFDPEKDAGKKVYVKKHIPRKEAEARRRRREAENDALRNLSTAASPNGMPPSPTFSLSSLRLSPIKNDDYEKVTPKKKPRTRGKNLVEEADDGFIGAPPPQPPPKAPLEFSYGLPPPAPSIPPGMQKDSRRQNVFLVAPPPLKLPPLHGGSPTRKAANKKNEVSDSDSYESDSNGMVMPLPPDSKSRKNYV